MNNGENMIITFFGHSDYMEDAKDKENLLDILQSLTDGKSVEFYLGGYGGFDNFALKAEELFFVLWHMNQAGWFKYAKGFVFGRTLFEGTFLDMSYEDAIKRALGEEIPIIMEVDIGHVAPKFTIINGAIGHFIANNGKGSLKMECK